MFHSDFNVYVGLGGKKTSFIVTSVDFVWLWESVKTILVGRISLRTTVRSAWRYDSWVTDHTHANRNKEVVCGVVCIKV